MGSGEGDGSSVTVWWTPDCGHVHVEDDPKTISVTCTDGCCESKEDDPETAPVDPQ